MKLVLFLALILFLAGCGEPTDSSVSPGEEYDDFVSPSPKLRVLKFQLLKGIIF